jgi:EAL domain-containing protein (putative c-di-GMP-specific phosphodiesterase class I)
MNKKTIAEFVGNAVIEEILIDIGIDYGQGYHIHKPEPWFEVS